MLGDAFYLTQHHQLYIDEYFYINCTNTVESPDDENGSESSLPSSQNGDDIVAESYSTTDLL